VLGETGMVFATSASVASYNGNGVGSDRLWETIRTRVSGRRDEAGEVEHSAVITTCYSTLLLEGIDLDAPPGRDHRPYSSVVC